MQDIMEEYDEENNLDKIEKKRVQKMCNSICSKLIQENWDDVFID